MSSLFIIFYILFGLSIKTSGVNFIRLNNATLSCVLNNDLTQIVSDPTLRITWTRISNGISTTIMQFRNDTKAITYPPAFLGTGEYDFNPDTFELTVTNTDATDCSLKYDCSSTTGYTSNAFLINCTVLDDCVVSSPSSPLLYSAGDSPKTITYSLDTTNCIVNGNANFQYTGVKSTSCDGMSCSVTVAEADLSDGVNYLNITVTLENAINTKAYIINYSAASPTDNPTTTTQGANVVTTQPSTAAGGVNPPNNAAPTTVGINATTTAQSKSVSPLVYLSIPFGVLVMIALIVVVACVFHRTSGYPDQERPSSRKQRSDRNNYRNPTNGYINESYEFVDPAQVRYYPPEGVGMGPTPNHGHNLQYGYSVSPYNQHPAYQPSSQHTPMQYYVSPGY